MRARLAAAAAYLKADPQQRAELRSSGLLLDVLPPPWSVESMGSGGWASVAGDPHALPAASAAMRMIANDVSMIPLMVYRETNQDGDAEKARDTWQWELLHQSPQPGTPGVVFWFNVSMGITARGNAHALKLKLGGEVAALQFMSGRVESRLDHGSVVYDWTRPQEATIVRGIPADRVIHWRGPNFDGGRDGLSVLALHRASFDTGLNQDSHQKQLYGNNAVPKVAFTTPMRLKEEQADEWIARYEARHRGQPGRPMLMSEGMTVAQLSIAAEDAQFLEQREYNVADVERIFLLPPGKLQEPKTRPPAETDLDQRYLRQAVAPQLALIAGTLEEDPDFFGQGSDLYPEHQASAIFKADIVARYGAYLQGRQAGWLSVNDIRAAENLPPIAGGDEYQTTPVGGAPNLQPTTSQEQPQ